MTAVHGLVKSYGPRRVLRGLGLEFPRGEILAIVGPNGAGKTTLLQVAATVILADGGDIRVEGHDVVHEAAAVKRLVGYSPSVPALYPQLSGRLVTHSGPTASVVCDRVALLREGVIAAIGRPGEVLKEAAWNGS